MVCRFWCCLWTLIYLVLLQMKIIDPAETVTETVTYTDSQSDRHGRICHRWKSAIECQLKLYYVTTGQGIWNVLHDALSLGHSQLPQKLMTNDVIMDNKQLKVLSWYVFFIPCVCNLISNRDISWIPGHSVREFKSKASMSEDRFFEINWRTNSYGVNS